jgi:hypothetical protein
MLAMYLFLLRHFLLYIAQNFYLPFFIYAGTSSSKNPLSFYPGISQICSYLFIYFIVVLCEDTLLCL